MGPKQVRKSTLSLSGHAPIVLHQESPIYIPGNDPFGPCRPVINMFDAFTDFMLYDGGLVPRVSRLANTGKVMWESWAALGDVLVGNLQREVVLWWYKEASNLAAQCMAMKVLAGQDAGQMVQANGAPLPAAADWLRVVTRLVDAGCQKRRQLHPGASPDAPDA